jgi:hypothetical protein
MSVKSNTKPEPSTAEAADIVVQIADIVLSQKKDARPSLSAISRATERAAGLLSFKKRDERTAAANSAAIAIAKRANLV